ncbi:hypothetical protein JTB14_010632 [Gonioctena quinquepunctata]|nr:hypothetical protein JTB14_010632 [Gonioctena quinquepunctata]
MTRTYKAPSTAYNLGLHIEEITLLMQTKAIQEGDNKEQDASRDLLDLINDGFKTDINKTVAENQSEKKKHKKVFSPTAADISALKTLLEAGRAEAYQTLKSELKHKAWKNLTGYTLISLQVFNRRRAGELERILTEDFKSCQFVDTDDILQSEFRESMKYLAKNYDRFFNRGKLNRQVPVILSEELIDCIEVLLEYRDQYGVLKSNPYLFGVPERSHITLKACNLMRYYANACGAPNPTRLRGTELRKQIATASSLKESALAERAVREALPGMSQTSIRIENEADMHFSRQQQNIASSARDLFSLARETKAFLRSQDTLTPPRTTDEARSFSAEKTLNARIGRR